MTQVTGDVAPIKNTLAHYNTKLIMTIKTFAKQATQDVSFIKKRSSLLLHQLNYNHKKVKGTGHRWCVTTKNTLAYYSTDFIIGTKKFMMQATGDVSLIKTHCSLLQHRLHYSC